MTEAVNISLSTPKRGLWLLVLGALLVLISVLSLRFGLRPTSWADLIGALGAYDALNPEHIVLRDIRLPRLPAAILAGGALGVAGALMQGLTRNALADPGLLGVNAGASIGVVTMLWLLGISDPQALIWAALAGALLASVIVLLLGGVGRARAHPARLVLAGAAVSAFFLAMSRAVLLISRQTLDVYRYWVLGGFDGLKLDQIIALVPFFAVGAGLAALAAIMMNALMLGDDTARALGVRVGLARLITVAAVVVLCAATVSMAGPIAFVGLIVPHLARPLAGADMRWLALFSALIGAMLMVCADALGRVILPGEEIQAGVMAAMIGGPALIWLVRSRRAMQL